LLINEDVYILHLIVFFVFSLLKFKTIIMEQSQISFSTEETVLPKQLKVLCILSLIMGGIMVIMMFFGIKQHYFPSETDKINMAESIKKIMEVNPNMDEVTAIMEKSGPNAIFGFIAEALSIIGVVLMLKLKKNGFYIYVAAELLPIIATVVIVGVVGLMGPFAMLGEKFHGLGIGYGVAALVIDLLFIFLYSKHLKSMS